MIEDIKGKVAIVTGSSRGIGKAIALALAREGVKVTINYIKHKKEAYEVEKMIKDMGGEAIVVRADVAVWEDVQRLVNETVKHFGTVDILVNNAGIITSHPITEMPIEEWDRVIAVNLSGPFYCAKAVAKYMIEKKWGRIINITSIGGIFGFPNEPHYSASKAGLIGLTKSLGKELTPHGILVAAIAPSNTETDMVSKAPPDLRKRLLMPPIGRFAKPEEIAEVVVFLCKHTYISGETIMVAGGL
ncbi:MAG: 3-oxoacyl-ACP reductase family protein [Candidatus Asgardarchaeia archaeon]|nr:MAG: beta-ketoacyl-ACP reductase [Candidatus Asgardarchaeum californiense]